MKSPATVPGFCLGVLLLPRKNKGDVSRFASVN